MSLTLQDKPPIQAQIVDNPSLVATMKVGPEGGEGEVGGMKQHGGSRNLPEIIEVTDFRTSTIGDGGEGAGSDDGLNDDIYEEGPHAKKPRRKLIEDSE